jgi:ADP-ribose pyrophosphatase
MKLEYEILAQQDILDAFFKMRRYRLRHTSFEGGWGGDIVRERIERLAAVSVLLYDPGADMLVFVEQFRVGLMGAVEPPWCLETVSGFCDRAHESPEEVARREVQEETGCEVRILTPIGEFFVSPGMSVERISLYCGLVDASQADGVHGLEHEGEEMRVVKLSRDAAMAELFRRLNSTSVIIALQWLALNRDRLLQRWGLEEPGGG